MTNISRIVVFCLCMFNSPVSWAQDKISDYVQKNTRPIQSINPDADGYTDLEAIGTAIGNARIVFLGEQDHGDAPTFLAKTRLIKYLHEKKGFDVLAFESDFFALTDGWDGTPRNKDTINPFIKENIFGVWTSCNTCSELLFKYIPESFQTEKPLILTGFDDQLCLSHSTRKLISKLDSVLNKQQIPIIKAPNYLTEILPLLNVFYKINQLDSNTLKKRGFYLEEIKKQLITTTSPDDYWVVIVENMIRYNFQIMYQRNSTDYWKRFALRDKQMAHNLKWLAENKYPDKKIIVWAANYHVSKFNSHYPEEFLNEARTMGDEFTNDTIWSKKTYIIGFTSLQGTAGRVTFKTYNLPKLNKNSFERWVNPEYEYAFTDFKTYNTKNPTANEDFFMSGSVKGNCLHTHHKAQWNRIFDGIFFIRDMYPCELVTNK